MKRDELAFDLPDLQGWIVLVTGGRGYIGTLVCKIIRQLGGLAVPQDLPDDILHMGKTDVDAAIHLAAHKHAPLGETHPVEVSKLNIEGTAQVVKAVSPKPIVFASTCKAADPCTVYGASKLIGERIVLNAGGTVVRLVNVVGSSGSVMGIWSQIPDDQPIPVTDCHRMWMTPSEAAQSLVYALTLDPGRYIPNVPEPEPVSNLASRAYPERPQTVIPLRRGDRPVERLVGEYESRSISTGPLSRVVDLWEQAPLRAAA